MFSLTKECINYFVVRWDFIFNSVNSAWAKRPPEIRNQQDLNLEPDMHGQDLSGNEYVKFDLNGFNFSESNLEGAVFNNSKLQNSKFNGANLEMH